MTTNDPNLFSAALAAIQGALESGPRTAVELEDFHRKVFRDQLKRDAALRAQFQPRVYEDEQRDAEEFFAAEQCPSDATFR